MDYTVIVNSCDSFEDCWDPFFTLVESYWPTPRPTFILNTDTRDYAFPGIDVVASRVGGERVVPWGERLQRCLSTVSSDVILYLQEDYFLDAPVDVGLIASMADKLTDRNADVIRLMEPGNAGPWRPTDDADLWEVDPSSPYFVSLQAALWRREALGSLLRAHETPWQFELWGSARARRRGDCVLCVDRDRHSPDESSVVPYTPTGVIKGKWYADAVVDLFGRHDIPMDFSRRGFIEPAPDEELVRLSTRDRIARKRPFVRNAVARLRSL